MADPPHRRSEFLARCAASVLATGLAVTVAAACRAGEPAPSRDPAPVRPAEAAAAWVWFRQRVDASSQGRVHGTPLPFLRVRLAMDRGRPIDRDRTQAGALRLCWRGEGGGWSDPTPLVDEVRLPSPADRYRLSLTPGVPAAGPRSALATMEVDLLFACPVRPPSGGTPSTGPCALEIVPRSEWGARPPREAYATHAPEMLVIHHTWRPTQARYAEARTIRGIQDYHMDSPYTGWDDVGYHFLIGPDGLTWEGRPPWAVGAHCVPNTGKVGVNLIGDFDFGCEEVTAEAWNTLVDLCAALCIDYDIPADAIMGHRDFAPKSCPGDTVYERLPDLIRTLRSRVVEGDEAWTAGAIRRETILDSPLPMAESERAGTR